jgi:hypothetical protein
MSEVKGQPRREKVHARVTEDMLNVLDYLEGTTGKSKSQLINEALEKEYPVADLKPKAAAFIADRVRLINRYVQV